MLQYPRSSPALPSRSTSSPRRRSRGRECASASSCPRSRAIPISNAIFRVQMNTLEWMPIFLPSPVAGFADPSLARSHGGHASCSLAIVGAALSAYTGYSKAVEKRSPVSLSRHARLHRACCGLGAFGAAAWSLIHPDVAPALVIRSTKIVAAMSYSGASCLAAIRCGSSVLPDVEMLLL